MLLELARSNLLLVDKQPSKIRSKQLLASIKNDEIRKSQIVKVYIYFLFISCTLSCVVLTTPSIF